MIKKLLLILSLLFFPLISQAATFGYATVGGSSGIMNGNDIYANPGFIIGGDTVESVSFSGSYAEQPGRNFKGVILNTSGEIVSNGVSPSASISSAAAWNTATYSTKPTVSDLTSYYASIIVDNSFYLSGDVGTMTVVDTTNSYSTPENATLADVSQKYSIYATYTRSYDVSETHAAYTDGAFCYVTGGACFSQENGNLRAGYRTGASYGDCEAAVRFQSVAIPQGATIDAAYFYYEAWDTDASTDNIKILGEDADSASAISATYANANSPHNKTATTASVSWTLPNQVYGTSYKSPDIKSVIQEITDRVGWATGNNLCLLFRNDGASENHNLNNEVGKLILVVNYTEDGGAARRIIITE